MPITRTTAKSWRARFSNRLADGLAHIGVGVVYPKKLRSLEDFSKLKKSLREEELQFFIGSETDKPNWQIENLNHPLLVSIAI
jgi:hypothetical protein